MSLDILHGLLNYPFEHQFARLLALAMRLFITNIYHWTLYNGHVPLIHARRKNNRNNCQLYQQQHKMPENKMEMSVDIDIVILADMVYVVYD